MELITRNKVVDLPREEGEWQILLPGPHFGEWDSAWQRGISQSEGKNITWGDRNVE